MLESNYFKIILSAESEKDFLHRVEGIMKRFDCPMYHAITLIEVGRSLEGLAYRVINSNENRKDAMLNLLYTYLISLNIVWAKFGIDKMDRTKTSFDLFQSELDLFQSRYVI